MNRLTTQLSKPILAIFLLCCLTGCGYVEAQKAQAQAQQAMMRAEAQAKMAAVSQHQAQLARDSEQQSRQVAEDHFTRLQKENKSLREELEAAKQKIKELEGQLDTEPGQAAN